MGLHNYQLNVESQHSNNPVDLRRTWDNLCAAYLPITTADSIWRFSRESLPGDPSQGWKLHVSATVLTAAKVLQAIAPVLHRYRVLFKAPASLQELDKLNSGISYGYSQIGKFVTIYPQTEDEAVFLAEQLHGLTRGIPAPAVPFDFRYKTDSPVYYRYGAFKKMTAPGADQEFALLAPDGNLVVDSRTTQTMPEWVQNPFRQSATHSPVATRTSLPPTLKPFRALAQRGRGGVYQAIDLSVEPPRLCILKQGRSQGEITLDGRDGAWRVQHEEKVLSLLAQSGVNVSRVYSSFSIGENYYLISEFIEGPNVEEWLAGKRRRLPVRAVMELSLQLAEIMNGIHAAGWVWRDCKPRNVILTNRRTLRPVDFEGACPVTAPDPLRWGTTSYLSPESAHHFAGQSRLPEDLYALGVVIHLLLMGYTPDQLSNGESGRGRRAPAALFKLIQDLLHKNPRRRPRAAVVVRRLKLALNALATSDQSVRPTRRARTANRGSARKSS